MESSALPANNAPAPVESFDDDLMLSINCIGSSDQACKECRRRKSQCNRALPTCDLCDKYRRHCLYEKHSRTPLTRKHLTEVEARLERAETLLKQMRALMPPRLRPWEKQSDALQVQHGDASFNFSTAVGATQDPKPDECRVKDDAKSRATASSASPSPCVTVHPHRPLHGHAHADPDHQRLLERPPLEDFAWNENDSARRSSLSLGTDGDGAVEDTPLSDGMASLSVNEHESGYLGVASGAALLRLLEPQARQRTPSRAESNASCMTPMTAQPDANRHMTEAMLDAFFQDYHVSYPMVHEPTFRAQYSEVIPRPHGQCWTALAYVVAAIGAWTRRFGLGGTRWRRARRARRRR